jgi:hypothetical protein
MKNKTEQLPLFELSEFTKIPEIVMPEITVLVGVYNGHHWKIWKFNTDEEATIFARKKEFSGWSNFRIYHLK